MDILPKWNNKASGNIVKILNCRFKFKRIICLLPKWWANIWIYCYRLNIPPIEDYLTAFQTASIVSKPVRLRTGQPKSNDSALSK